MNVSEEFSTNIFYGVNAYSSFSSVRSISRASGKKVVEKLLPVALIIRALNVTHGKALEEWEENAWGIFSL